MSKLAKATLISLFTIALFTALNFGQQTLEQSANAVNNDRMAPHFIVDPYWPQPLPNKWLLGRTIGIAVDERDHLYVVHRDQDAMFMSQELGLVLGRAECCSAAPPILEFDRDGNLIIPGAAQVKAIPGLSRTMASM